MTHHKRAYRQELQIQISVEHFFAEAPNQIPAMNLEQKKMSGVMEHLENCAAESFQEPIQCFALPKELRHTRTAVTVADHNAAFLQRLRHGDDEEVSAPNG